MSLVSDSSFNLLIQCFMGAYNHERHTPELLLHTLPARSGSGDLAQTGKHSMRHDTLRSQIWPGWQTRCQTAGCASAAQKLTQICLSWGRCCDPQMPSLPKATAGSHAHLHQPAQFPSSIGIMHTHLEQRPRQFSSTKNARLTGVSSPFLMPNSALAHVCRRSGAGWAQTRSRPKQHSRHSQMLDSGWPGTRPR